MMINTYIKYAYYLLIIILLIIFIKLLVTLKPLKKEILNLKEGLNETNGLINDTKEKVEKISYTLNNSIPFFSYLFFLIIVLCSALKDYSDTRLTKRSLVKSCKREYNYMQHVLKYTPNPSVKKELMGKLIKNA